MSEPAFSLNLGNGLYMDSEGVLHSGPSLNVPIYKAPFKLPVDAQKISSAVSDVKSALSDINKKGFLHDKWGKVDEVDKMLDLLSGIGKLAAALAPVAGLLSFAVDALNFFGILKSGPSALETLVTQRFNALAEQVTAIAQQIQTHDLRNGRLAVENLVNQVKAYMDQLEQANPDLQQLQNDRNVLLGAYSDHIDGFAKLLDRQTWYSNFRNSEHTQIWPFIAGVLFTLPGSKIDPNSGSSVGPDVLPAPLPSDGLNFDHRLMVPLSSYAAENYLTAIRGISPEYRTSGDFRPDIRTFADKIADIAQLMRERVLARTIYKAVHFAWPVLIPPYEVAHSGPLGAVATIAPTCGRWPVGAIDLRYHDDTYFNDFIGQLGRDEALGRPAQPKFGSMNLRWIPPAVLEISDFGNYKITNPDECADAANAQSEKDYADLLAMSGYFELSRLATLFRNEATEPPKSQTVHARTPQIFRNPLPSFDVTVESNPIKYTGEVITSPARREPQECMDKVEVWTQPIKRPKPVEYRVKLRTLASLNSKDDWQERPYSDYQRVDYEPDPANQGFLRLALSTAYVEVASHDLISEWTASPREGSKHLTDTIDMLADTFDWWIPVASPFMIDEPFDMTLAQLRASGWTGGFGGAQQAPRFGSMRVLSDVSMADEVTNPHLNYIPELFWKAGQQDWDGQHRDIKRETIRIEYELQWAADRLNFTIKSRPSDRNYIVFLVIEEKMQASASVLHTAVALPINGLLTYVPQKFFDDEFAAHAKTASVIASLIARLIPSVEDIRPDPVVGWVRPADLATRAGVNKVLELANEHRPDLLREIVSQVSRKTA